MELRAAHEPQLSGASARPRGRHGGFPRLPAHISLLTLLLAALALMAPAPAIANDLQIPRSPTVAPPFHRLTSIRVIAIADRQPKVRAERGLRHGRLRPVAYAKGATRWQVSYFEGPVERVQLLIDDTTGRVLETWTGPQVAWAMARGYRGAFAGSVSSLFVWIPLCILFVLPFVDFRRPRRVLHLDLAVLVAFSASLAFFNHGLISESVPLAYPVLGYLVVRLLMLGVHPRARPLRLIPHVPLTWLALALVFLIGFRITLNVVDSGIVDIGYAGVVGADRIVHGHGIYGNFPQEIQHGDTYGPVTYLAYVPFRVIFGWSGHWDTVPAAHAAALVFDTLTMLGLFLLGRRMRAGPAGHELGVALVFAWAACPFTFYALDSNTNDTLVSALLVGSLLGLRSAPARGAALGLAAAAKFAPIALWPLFAAANRSGERRLRATIICSLALAALIALSFAPFIPHGGLRAIYDRTLGYQAARGSPFSLWGQYHGLGWLWTATKAATLGLALAVPFLPGRRSIAGCAALGAAVLLALQLCASHWFYLYIVWFLPFALVALFSPYRTGERSPPQPEPEAEASRPDVNPASPVPAAA